MNRSIAFIALSLLSAAAGASRPADGAYDLAFEIASAAPVPVRSGSYARPAQPADGAYDLAFEIASAAPVPVRSGSYARPVQPADGAYDLAFEIASRSGQKPATRMSATRQPSEG